MIQLFDSHCHFETADAAGIRSVLERAGAAGVSAIAAVGGSAILNETALLAKRISDEDRTLPRVKLVLGHDRDQIGMELPSELPSGGGLIDAVGEIGLDYYYSPDTRDSQRRLFAAQLDLARSHGLPVVIHTREADSDTVSLLKEIPSRGIIHCYTGDANFAKAYLELGFFISFSGIVTFNRAENVRSVARIVPSDRILIETDSPFLSPVPMRGKTNEPAYVRHTCDFLARLRGVDPEEFAAATFANAESAFS